MVALPGIDAFDCAAVFQTIHINTIRKQKLNIMVDWSDDRIAALSDQDLKNLLVNAEKKSVAEVVAQGRAELEKRDAAKPRKTSERRTDEKDLAHNMPHQPDHLCTT